MKRKITIEQITKFKVYLESEEKSNVTVEKYIRDVFAFYNSLPDKEFEKADVICYKRYLIENYMTASVNSMLSSINSFFSFCEWYELRVRTIRCQRKIFTDTEKELKKSEYERLLESARNKKNQRIYYIMQTICASGIRISELRFITVEAVKLQRAEVKCKGKTRWVFLPKDLCKLLRAYIFDIGIKSGSIFVTRNGKPIDRRNIWSDMKKLCENAGVARSKVFPHNLRHLFAKTFYSQQKDIVRLADLLGHSSINTTRIYTVESGANHRRKIQKLGLVSIRA